MADEGDEAKAFADAFNEQALTRHRQSSAARPRLRNGPVICIDCGENIPLERLAAVATADRCIQCQVLRDARSN